MHREKSILKLGAFFSIALALLVLLFVCTIPNISAMAFEEVTADNSSNNLVEELPNNQLYSGVGEASVTHRGVTIQRTDGAPLQDTDYTYTETLGANEGHYQFFNTNMTISGEAEEGFSMSVKLNNTENNFCLTLQGSLNIRAIETMYQYDRGCTIDVEDDCKVGYINLGVCTSDELFSIVGSGTLNLIGPGLGGENPLFNFHSMILKIDGPTININLTQGDLVGLYGSVLNLITGNLIIDCSQADVGSSSLLLATTSGVPAIDISDNFGELFLNGHENTSYPAIYSSEMSENAKHFFEDRCLGSETTFSYTDVDVDNLVPIEVAKIEGWDTCILERSENIPCYTIYTGEITPPAPTLSDIKIVTEPEKKEYELGESLDLTGLTVALTYSDGSEETDIPTMDNISGFDSETPGVKAVVVTYSDPVINETVSDTFNVIVKKPEPVNPDDPSVDDGDVTTQTVAQTSDNFSLIGIINIAIIACGLVLCLIRRREF